MMMQFVCTARSADDEDYRPLAETPLTLDFAYDHGVSTLADPAVWQVTLTNNAAAPWRGVVKLELCVAYDAPRFFLPGFLYGRNRGEAPIRVDNRYPRLRAGTPEFPASPWWMVRADRLSHPAAFLLDGGRWYGLSAAPYFVRQNGVLQPWQPGRAGTFAQFAGFTCSLNTGSVGYTLGYENAPWLFVQSHNIKPRAPMGENCLTLAAGEIPALTLKLKPGEDVLRPLSARHPEDETVPGLLILRPEGRLFFINVQHVAARMRELIATHQPEVVVLDMSRVLDVEYSALMVLKEGERQASAKGVTLWLAGLNPGVLENVRRSGLAARMGDSRMLFNARAAIRQYQQMRGAPGPAPLA